MSDWPSSALNLLYIYTHWPSPDRMGDFMTGGTGAALFEEGAASQPKPKLNQQVCYGRLCP